MALADVLEGMRVCDVVARRVVMNDASPPSRRRAGTYDLPPRILFVVYLIVMMCCKNLAPPTRQFAYTRTAWP